MILKSVYKDVITILGRSISITNLRHLQYRVL